MGSHFRPIPEHKPRIRALGLEAPKLVAAGDTMVTAGNIDVVEVELRGLEPLTLWLQTSSAREHHTSAVYHYTYMNPLRRKGRERIFPTPPYSRLRPQLADIWLTRLADTRPQQFRGKRLPRLTKRVCDAARYTGDPGTKQRCVVWDDELSGFGLRVTPNGRKGFMVMYRPAGSRATRIMTVGSFGVLTPDQARKKAKELLGKIANGEDPLATRKEKNSGDTLKDLASRWLDDYAKPHRRRWQEAAHHISRYIVPALGAKRMTAVSRADARRLHANIGKTAPIQANRVLETLRAIYAWAIRTDVLPAHHSNPGIVTRFKERSRTRWLTAREITRLAAAINREDDIYAQAAIRLLLLTGSRRTELLRARWDRVDFDGRRVLLEDTKTGEPKVTALSSPAMEILRGLPRQLHSPWLFPSPKDPRDPRRDLKRPWARIRKRAKLPDARLHDLRRTTGSWLVQRGIPLKVVGEALGHRDTRATEIYARIAAEQPAEALELLGAALSGAVKPRATRRFERLPELPAKGA